MHRPVQLATGTSNCHESSDIDMYLFTRGHPEFYRLAVEFLFYNCLLDTFHRIKCYFSLANSFKKFFKMFSMPKVMSYHSNA